MKISNCAQRLDDDEENTESIPGTNQLQLSLNCDPNPSNGQFIIALKSDNMESTPAGIEIVNSLNQIVYRENVLITNGELQKEIDVVRFLSDEIYVVKVVAGDKIYSGRMIINQQR